MTALPAAQQYPPPGAPHEGRFVAYYRVSTERQGKSGLGLEAQQRIVRDYLNGGEHKIIKEYTDIASGKDANRPELQKALRYAKAQRAVLLIARLDRLARDVHFIAGLQKSGTRFVACDIPEANNFTIHIFAAAAEYERRRISERTSEALQAKKARGHKLGTPATPEHMARIARKGRPIAAAKLKARADEFAENLRDTIDELRGQSLEAIARELNARGFPTPRGGKWYAASVANLLRRLNVTTKGGEPASND